METTTTEVPAVIPGHLIDTDNVTKPAEVKTESVFRESFGPPIKGKEGQDSYQYAHYRCSCGFEVVVCGCQPCKPTQRLKECENCKTKLSPGPLPPENPNKPKKAVQRPKLEDLVGKMLAMTIRKFPKQPDLRGQILGKTKSRVWVPPEVPDDQIEDFVIDSHLFAKGLGEQPKIPEPKAQPAEAPPAAEAPAEPVATEAPAQPAVQAEADGPDEVPLEDIAALAVPAKYERKVRVTGRKTYRVSGEFVISAESLASTIDRLGLANIDELQDEIERQVEEEVEALINEEVTPGDIEDTEEDNTECDAYEAIDVEEKLAAYFEANPSLNRLFVRD